MTYTAFTPPRTSDERMVTRRFSMFVDGRPTEARSGSVLERPSPAYTGYTASVIPEGDTVDADLAVAAARRAFDDGPWPRMSGADRSRAMFAVADLMEGHAEELAVIDSLDGGKAISGSRGEVAGAIRKWRYAAGHAEGQSGISHNAMDPGEFGMMLREPLGVVGVITPWNYPLTIAAERIPWALGAGCTVVLKPSEFTSGSSIRMAELAFEAGIPEGVLNVITGYGPVVGQRLAEHPDVDYLSFTGSRRVGGIVGGIAAGNIKRVGLELGGKAPQVVFDDADLAAAAAGVADSVFFNSGQTCVAGTRLIAQRGIARDLVDLIRDHATRVPIGDPLDEAVTVGSLIHGEALAKVTDYVEGGVRAGATLAIGGSRIGDTGNFYEPTVFTDVAPEMRIAREEIFGPVLSVFEFDDAAEAIRLANDTPYGLSAFVWSNNLDRALTTIRQLRAGRTGINSNGGGGPEMGIGGYKGSGLGHELGQFGFDEYSAFKNVFVSLDPSRSRTRSQTFREGAI